MRSIGISNFGLGRCERLYANALVVPAVNQLENHVRFQQGELVDWLQQKGTVVAGLGVPSGQAGGTSCPTLSLRTLGRTTARLQPRWHYASLLSAGLPSYPKASVRERLKANMEIFDFALTDDEMRTIRAMDGGSSFFSWSWI